MESEIKEFLQVIFTILLLFWVAVFVAVLIMEDDYAKRRARLWWYALGLGIGAFVVGLLSCYV